MWTTLRSKVFAFLFLLMLISLMGVGVSFVLTQNLNSKVSEMNLRLFPMQKNLVVLSSGIDLLTREMERSLGFSNWNNALWKPRKIPNWTIETIRNALEKIQPSFLSTLYWKDWYSRMLRMNEEISKLSSDVFTELQNGNKARASEIYSDWYQQIGLFQREILWAKKQLDQESKESFETVQEQVSQLRLALQVLLLVVISVALIMVWMGERALRPIAHLRKMVRQITERGALTHQERANLPQVSLFYKDEVSELAREFHTMATALIEREKMIESQKDRLEEQNRLLLQMSELQKRLQDAEHMAGIGRLSAQVAHEIGNPLHSIGLEAELAIELSQEFRLNEQGDSSSIHLKQSLQSILASVERLKNITQNYLRLSKGNWVKKPVNLASVIESALATYANSIQQSGTRVQWNFPQNALEEETLAIEADPVILEQAFGNVIRNSLQALGSVKTIQPRLEIQVSLESSSTLKVQFFDNGPGIDEEAKKNIFKPFFTTKAEGTGLGLSFVKKIFNDLGGEFVLRDSNSNGTLFEGILPSIRKKTQLQPEVSS